ncbi:transposase [Pseudonocardia sulfidoxydans NBRC 16205]|uniref:Transposase n=1 Tax=Pseudonocardia sulfidoxydans NBRC 16205 TaxID=1223511 RepID=A0A511DQH5_9PSEU|nr:IS3 family transposase [Pseudonocardia sulfidoxydans]GEL27080.1 transposase [Pseudonocardia sulfidoxydans NBRC 16205]
MKAVDALKDRFGISPILRVLGVAASSYYGWLAQQRDPSERRRADTALVEEIRRIHGRSGATYGAPRVHATLRRGGQHVSRKRVERLMREDGLQGAFLRKRWRTASTRQNPRATPAPDLVNRDFTAAAPDRLWVADATRIPCGEGVFWLAAVRDAFSNRIVGWRCSDRCDTDLILGALEYAVWTRNVRGGKIVHHSDRGSNYTSLRFGQRLEDHGILASMGSVGDSYDNALMENFFSTLKTELVYRNSWRSKEEAENALFAYIDAWYNTERIQARLGWQSPDEYETAWRARQAIQDDQPATPVDGTETAPAR